MLKNFITVAVRSFSRQGLYSVINIVGLTTGLMSALFIMLWVQDEVGKNKFHAHADKIFLVVSNLQFSDDGSKISWPITPGPLADDVLANFPQVESAVRTAETGALRIAYGENSFMERGYYADPDFFSLFSFPLQAGSHQLHDISSISISSRLAKKIFGSEDPIGKNIAIGMTRTATVTAVFEDLTSQSSLRFDFVLPLEIYKQQRGDGFSYDNFDHPLYLKLANADQVGELQNALNVFIQKLAASQGEDADRIDFFLQPFTDIYLYNHYVNGIPSGGRIQYVQIFSAVAVFILIIACINFMNMATARAANRAKEVGVRKVAGAQRSSLIIQFMAESTLISTVAMFIAVAFVYLLLPSFNSVVNKNIILNPFDLHFVATACVIIFITGLLAGSYPAFFLSSYRPADVLKGNTSSLLSGTRLRQLLIVFQFAITVVLVASSIVIYNQIEFIRTKDVGYDRRAIMTFRLTGNLWREYDAFRNDVSQYPTVLSISKANESLVEVQNQNGSVSWPGKAPGAAVFFRTVIVDYGFIETMGLSLEQGRFFSEAFNDTASYIVTTAAVEAMGLEEPIGTTISQWEIPGKIIGVVSDFHSRSLHSAVDPVVFMCKPGWTNNVVIKFDASKTAETMALIETSFKKYNPSYPFTYSFLEDDFEALYATEKVTGTLALGFTAMAIIISGLGLLGLAAYSTARRTKEISVRKILGASVVQLVSMMSISFIKLSVAAVIIGCPIAYYLMDAFLKGYEYHTALSWDIFVITSLLVVLIALLIIIFQVVRAAIANPANALRNE